MKGGSRQTICNHSASLHEQILGRDFHCIPETRQPKTEVRKTKDKRKKIKERGPEMKKTNIEHRISNDEGRIASNNL